MCALRVLHVGKYYPPFAGGIENFHHDLACEQVRAGLTVANLVHHHETGRATLRESLPGGTTWRVRIVGRALYTPLSPSFGVVLRAVTKEFRPDLIHFHFPNPSVLWGFVLPRVRAPCWVVHWHSDIIASNIDRRLGVVYGGYAMLERAFLARSHAIISTSPRYLDASRPLRLWRNKCHVVPLGIADARITAPSATAVSWAQSQWAGRAFRVLSIGRLTYYKGYNVLVDAAAKARDIQVLVAGNGEDRSRIQRRVDDHEIGDRFRLLGFVEDERLRALLTTCDCVCLPSLERTEAFGMVLLEAMSCGKPVIASDIPGSGVGWVVTTGGMGLLMPPGDADALRHALVRLSRDDDLRAALGESGRAKFFERFTMQVVERMTRDVYERALADRARSADAS